MLRFFLYLGSRFKLEALGSRVEGSPRYSV